MALQDVQEGQGQAADVDNDQGGNGGPSEDLVGLGQGEVEKEDGRLGGHEGGILDPSACVEVVQA